MGENKSASLHLVPDWHDPGDGDLNGVAVAGVPILTTLRVELYSDHPGLFRHTKHCPLAVIYSRPQHLCNRYTYIL